MEKTNFIDAIKKSIRSKQFTLPVFDAVSMKIQMELIKKEPNFGTIEKFILSDQALFTNVLKIVNSARYRGLVEISTVKSAIMRIGISEIARIILMDINKKMFRSRDRRIDAIMKKLWQHSIGCAFAAGLLSVRLDFGVMQNEAFFGGLFHDIGKLLILKVIAEKKQKDRSAVVPEELLLSAMELLHTEQGYFLMQQINLPQIFAVVARDHHSQGVDRDNYLLVLVRMANHVCHHLGIGLVCDPTIDLLETREAAWLKLSASDLEALKDFLKSTPTLSE